MAKTKALSIINKLTDPTPLSLLQIAIEKGESIDKLEKLMSLHAVWEKNQALKAYTAAMAAFKTEPPDIEKDKKVKFRTDKGETAYNHASLANVTKKINASLAVHGLSAAWTTSQETEGKVKVTCRITHALGHYEETSLTANNDTSGSKNPIQALGSTISYLERYTILALTGLATHEMDNDGQTVEYISEKQFSLITDFIDSKKVDVTKFLAYMNADELKKIPASDFNKAIVALKAAKGSQ